MTCDDFKKFNSNGIDGILQLTRAERSACAQHWTQCFKCRDWTMGLTFEMTESQELEVLQTKIQDAQDPEVFQYTGDASKFDLDKEGKDAPKTTKPTN